MASTVGHTCTHLLAGVAYTVPYNPLKGLQVPFPKGISCVIYFPNKPSSILHSAFTFFMFPYSLLISFISMLCIPSL